MLKNKEILIGKYLSGNINPEEKKKLEDWLQQNSANQLEFDSAKKLWETSASLKVNPDADVEKAWEEFKLLRDVQPRVEFKKNTKQTFWLKIAAAIMLFMVTAVALKFFFVAPAKQSPVVYVPVQAPVEKQPEPEFIPEPEPVFSDTLLEEAPSQTISKHAKKITFPSHSKIATVSITAADSAEIFMLPDNSIVYLNENSKLEYPMSFNKTNRRVTLIGEAYFDIQKDSGQFIVSCEKTLIKGREATFNVKSYAADNTVEVIVANGTVEFSGVGYKDFKTLVLNSGESGYYNKAKSEISKSKHVRKNYKWWQKKSLRERIRNFFERILGKK